MGQFAVKCNLLCSRGPRERTSTIIETKNVKAVSIGITSRRRQRIASGSCDMHMRPEVRRWRIASGSCDMHMRPEVRCQRAVTVLRSRAAAPGTSTARRRRPTTSQNPSTGVKRTWAELDSHCRWSECGGGGPAVGARCDSVADGADIGRSQRPAGVGAVFPTRARQGARSTGPTSADWPPRR